jgi:hypothetical protein
MISQIIEWVFAILDLSGSFIMSSRRVRFAYRVWFCSNLGIAICNAYQHQWAFAFLFFGYFISANIGYRNFSKKNRKESDHPPDVNLQCQEMQNGKSTIN